MGNLRDILIHTNFVSSHYCSVYKNMIHPSFQYYLPQVITLLEKYNVKSAYLFGSVLSKEFDKNSDVDFLINMDRNTDPVSAGENYWGLYYDLKKLLNREIDLVSEKSLKNPYFIEELNQTKFPIYGQ